MKSHKFTINKLLFGMQQSFSPKEQKMYKNRLSIYFNILRIINSKSQELGLDKGIRVLERVNGTAIKIIGSRVASGWNDI